jgi:hypothetical protein
MEGSEFTPPCSDRKCFASSARNVEKLSLRREGWHVKTFDSSCGIFEFGNGTEAGQA